MSVQRGEKIRNSLSKRPSRTNSDNCTPRFLDRQERSRVRWINSSHAGCLQCYGSFFFFLLFLSLRQSESNTAVTLHYRQDVRNISGSILQGNPPCARPLSIALALVLFFGCDASGLKICHAAGESVGLHGFPLLCLTTQTDYLSGRFTLRHASKS